MTGHHMASPEGRKRRPFCGARGDRVRKQQRCSKHTANVFYLLPFIWLDCDGGKNLPTGATVAPGDKIDSGARVVPGSKAAVGARVDPGIGSAAGADVAAAESDTWQSTTARMEN